MSVPLIRIFFPTLVVWVMHAWDGLLPCGYEWVDIWQGCRKDSVACEAPVSYEGHSRVGWGSSQALYPSKAKCTFTLLLNRGEVLILCNTIKLLINSAFIMKTVKNSKYWQELVKYWIDRINDGTMAQISKLILVAVSLPPPPQKKKKKNK